MTSSQEGKGNQPQTKRKIENFPKRLSSGTINSKSNEDEQTDSMNAWKQSRQRLERRERKLSKERDTQDLWANCESSKP